MMLSRRDFLVLSLLAVPLPVLGQKAFRVAFLSASGRTPDGLPPALLRTALRALGYVEGRNVAYEARFAEGQIERLSEMAAELVQMKVDVIATLGSPATLAAKRTTTTIPIVIARTSGDAVATGMIASLARPGGNITGMSDESVQLSAKRMEMLKEAVPKAGVIAVLWNQNDQGMSLRYQEIEKAARVLKVEVQALGLRGPADFAEAFSAMAQRRPDAMFLVADGLTVANHKRVLEFASTQRIPTMYEFDVLVRDGGLMSYGPSLQDDFNRAALYIDRILKGAKPADLPAQQPTRNYLTLNLKTAAALGLTIPPMLLLRADQVVE